MTGSRSDLNKLTDISGTGIKLLTAGTAINGRNATARRETGHSTRPRHSYRAYRSRGIRPRHQPFSA